MFERNLVVRVSHFQHDAFQHSDSYCRFRKGQATLMAGADWCTIVRDIKSCHCNL